MKRFTKKELAEKVTVTCYDRTETMTRGKALEKFFEGARYCDGCESERYWEVYGQLMEGLTEVSDQPREVSQEELEEFIRQWKGEAEPVA